MLCWLLLAAAAWPADTAVVLMYHRFGEDDFPSTSIRIEQFRAQMEYLSEAGFAVVPLADVHAALREGRPLPERAVAITVDDAYRSVYEVAWPVFRAYGYPFTVFVATDAVDDELPSLMTWAQMREMSATGATFANHGAAHRSVLERADGASDAEWLAAVRADVDKGAMRIADELGLLPGSFAYPYGEYTTAVADLLRGMGYQSFGQQSGAIGPQSDDRALPRYPLAESFGDLDEFRTKVASLPLPVAAVDPWDPVTGSAQPAISITLAADDELLFAQLACYFAGQGKVAARWTEPGRQFSVGPARPVAAGRHRVNCTAPGRDGRYRWFSHQWIIQPQP